MTNIKMSLLILSIVLICCAGTVCAADSNNTVDIVSYVDSNEEYISVSDNELVDDVDGSVLSAQDELKDCNNEIINQSHEIELTGMEGGEPQLLTNNIDDCNGNQTIFTTIESQKNVSNLLSSSNEDILGASIDVTTYADLRNAIGNNAYSLINIKSNLVCDGSQITINRNNFVIDGNGYTIVINNNAPTWLFYGAKRSEITFKNINFCGGVSTVGHSIIYMLSSTKISVQNCNFSNLINYRPITFYAEGLSMATTTTFGSSYVNVTHCNFKNITHDINIAGGAISFYYGVHNHNSITFCDFVEVNSVHGGAISIFSSDSIIDHCNFSNCYTTNLYPGYGYGGALTLLSGASYVNITNCNFKNNTASGVGGGAIMIYDSTCTGTLIDNCTFIDNTAPDGGAIYFSAGKRKGKPEGFD